VEPFNQFNLFKCIMFIMFDCKCIIFIENLLPGCPGLNHWWIKLAGLRVRPTRLFYMEDDSSNNMMMRVRRRIRDDQNLASLGFIRCHPLRRRCETPKCTTVVYTTAYNILQHTKPSTADNYITQQCDH